MVIGKFDFYNFVATRTQLLIIGVTRYIIKKNLTVKNVL